MPKKTTLEPRIAPIHVFSMPKFRRGSQSPYAVRWYGITSLYGHFRKFISLAIASESVDSRDWMRAETGHELLQKIAYCILKGEKKRLARFKFKTFARERVRQKVRPIQGDSLTQILKRDVWIDYIGDTGDDREVSESVGQMLSQTYVLKTELGSKILKRGDILMFGGDTAYPVATANEIQRRLIEPWNRAFRTSQDKLSRRPRRILLGVPGNHDWYDGLDGFARLFRAGLPPQSSRKKGDKQDVGRVRSRRKVFSPTGAVARKLHVDEAVDFVKLLSGTARFIKNLFLGVPKKSPKKLILRGYTAVQQASYFAFPLAPGLDLWGIDRQFDRPDFRQRSFFETRRSGAPDSGILLLSSDPAFAYGEPNEPGQNILQACHLDFDRDAIFYIAGDFHHYERRNVGRSSHIVSGGGGAFLHGTRIRAYQKYLPLSVYPNGEETKYLLRFLPFKMMVGESGYLIHWAAGLLALYELYAARSTTTSFVLQSLLQTFCISSLLYLIAGHRRNHPKEVLMASLPFGLLLGLLPVVTVFFFQGGFLQRWVICLLSPYAHF